ncbi:MAG: glycoside hydrolase family 16 protein [Flavobacteriales bacterium]|nr:glycoside hydrolase family 16 protein [Flavobacteriales bacterium]
MRFNLSKTSIIAAIITLPLLWGSCDEPVAPTGCTDITASNYADWAVIDDESCEYTESGALIFVDNFEGSSLDNSKWTHDIGTGNWGWGNGELQYYKAQNTTVSEGIAKITAKKNDNGLNYTSSKIKTDGKFSFRYGKVQASIKTVNGKGFWPAFWLLPSGGNWPCDGEIDIMEQWAKDGNTNVTTGAAHLGECPYNESTRKYKNFERNISSLSNETDQSFANDFHIYEIRWEPNKIDWYVDNQHVYQITPNSFPSKYTWPFNSNDWYIILNLAIDRNGPSAITEFPSQMEIDWVRVYALEHDN